MTKEDPSGAPLAFQLGLNLAQLSIPGAFRDRPRAGHNRGSSSTPIVPDVKTMGAAGVPRCPESADSGPAIVPPDDMRGHEWWEAAVAMNRRLLPPGTWRGTLVDGTGQAIPLSECAACGHRAPFHPERPWYSDHDCSQEGQ